MVDASILKPILGVWLLQPLPCPSPHKLRLADFDKWAARCATVRGREYETFKHNLELKAKTQRDETLTQSPITEPVEKFMEERDEWEGSAGDLLKLLTEQEYGRLVGEGAYERVQVQNVPKHWPKGPAAFGKELSRVSFLFPHMGLRVTRDRDKRSRKLKIRKLESFANFPVSPVTRKAEAVKPLYSYVSEGEGWTGPPVPLLSPPVHQVTGDSKVTGKKKSPVHQERPSKPRNIESEVEMTGKTEDIQEFPKK